MFRIIIPLRAFAPSAVGCPNLGRFDLDFFRLFRFSVYPVISVRDNYCQITFAEFLRMKPLGRSRCE